MNQKEAQELVEKRLQTEPEFRKKYDAFLAKRSAEGKLSDSELNEVNGGFYGIKLCPACGAYALTTFSFGVYSYCLECDYTEWFST